MCILSQRVATMLHLSGFTKYIVISVHQKKHAKYIKYIVISAHQKKHAKYITLKYWWIQTNIP